MKCTSCDVVHTKKYQNRPGPPYPANTSCCRGKVKNGNDGLKYKSCRTKNGVYRWKKL